MGKLDGVRFARVDFLGNTLQLMGDVEYDRLRAQVEAVGKTISAVDAAGGQLGARRSGPGHWDFGII